MIKFVYNQGADGSITVTREGDGYSFYKIDRTHNSLLAQGVNRLQQGYSLNCPISVFLPSDHIVLARPLTLIPYTDNLSQEVMGMKWKRNDAQCLECHSFDRIAFVTREAHWNGSVVETLYMLRPETFMLEISCYSFQRIQYFVILYSTDRKRFRLDDRYTFDFPRYWKVLG
ncbi:hypothetical protein BDQ17DRAFT_1335563 [Cyathus striatus]|nr:hypothetical protein BDQ17DRAFT_1335563 [Cyathus striatus]